MSRPLGWAGASGCATGADRSASACCESLGRAFGWSRALATIDRLTGEIAPRAKQTVRKARWAQPSTAANQPPGHNPPYRDARGSGRVGDQG